MNQITTERNEHVLRTKLMWTLSQHIFNVHVAIGAYSPWAPLRPQPLLRLPESPHLSESARIALPLRSNVYLCSQLCKRPQSWLRNLPEKAMTQSAKRGIILHNFCRAFIICHESFWTRQIVVDINKHKHADILKKENETKTSDKSRHWKSWKMVQARIKMCDTMQHIRSAAQLQPESLTTSNENQGRMKDLSRKAN